MKATLVRLAHKVLEVERKFHCGPDTLLRIRGNAGSLPFGTLARTGTNSFTDSYLDKDGILLERGIYVRRRGDCWQAKIRISGGFRNSGFEERVGREQICALLTANDIVAKREQDCLGLTEIARFETTRESFRANDDFEIVVDSTDFGCTVGEVELQQSLEDPDAATVQTVTQAMDSRIEAFMSSHAWAFDLDLKPQGKLSAYFEMIKDRKGRSIHT